MPKILFKWLACRRPEYRYFFLDNSVPKGTFPKTIAFGNQSELTICDPVAFINTERYQKIDINARSREEVYPSAQIMDIAANCGFLKECIRRIAVVNFVAGTGGSPYVWARNRIFEVLDRATLARAMNDEETAAIMREIAPQLVADR